MTQPLQQTKRTPEEAERLKQMLASNAAWYRDQLFRALFPKESPPIALTRRKRAASALWDRLGYRNQIRWADASWWVQDKWWSIIECWRDRGGRNKP